MQRVYAERDLAEKIAARLSRGQKKFRVDHHYGGWAVVSDAIPGSDAAQLLAAELADPMPAASMLGEKIDYPPICYVPFEKTPGVIVFTAPLCGDTASYFVIHSANKQALPLFPSDYEAAPITSSWSPTKVYLWKASLLEPPVMSTHGGETYITCVMPASKLKKLKLSWYP